MDPFPHMIIIITVLISINNLLTTPFKNNQNGRKSVAVSSGPSGLVH